MLKNLDPEKVDAGIRKFLRWCLTEVFARGCLQCACGAGRALAAAGSDAGLPVAAAIVPVMPPEGERLFLQALGLEELLTAPAEQALKAAEEAAAARARSRRTDGWKIDRKKLQAASAMAARAIAKQGTHCSMRGCNHVMCVCDLQPAFSPTALAVHAWACSGV